MTVTTREIENEQADASEEAAGMAVPDEPVRWWKRRAFKVSVRYVLAAGLLAGVLLLVPLGDVASSLKSASWRPLLGAAVLGVVVHTVQARRLQVLLGAVGLRWPVGRVLTVHLSAMAYGLVLPGGNLSGTAVRAYKLGKEQGRYAQAGAALFVDRVLATAMLGVSGLVCLAFTPLPGRWIYALVLAGIALVGVMALTPAVVGFGRVPGLGMAGRLPGVGKVLKKLAGVPRLPVRPVVHAALLALLAHGMGIAVCLLVGMSVGLGLGYWELGSARALMLVAALLPITIAGIGVRESAAVGVLGLMGQTAGQAVAFSLVFFGVMWVVPALLGAVTEAVGGRDRKPRASVEEAG